MSEQNKQEQATDNLELTHLTEKTPDELLSELLIYIDTTEDDSFDVNKVKACLETMQHQAPVIQDFNPEVSYQAFESKLTSTFENFDQTAAQETNYQPKRRRFHIASTVAVACLVVVILFFTADAYGFNFFSFLRNWGQDVIEINRSPQSGIMEMPANSNSEYVSLADALEKNGYSPDICPTWVPERFSLVSVSVDIIENQTFFSSLYKYEAAEEELEILVDYFAYSTVISKIEKNPQGYIYNKNGHEYYIITNLGVARAVRVEEKLQFEINGMLTEEELLKTIDSIYERQ